jgi:serine/threonine protein kinase/tetratricopeptide (TPR) repeat protein
MTDALDLIRAALQGRYQVERLLGMGGMASVYQARDERHHRSVAVKVLHADLIRALGVERFGREIEIAAQLSHPHILPLLDSGTLALGPSGPVCPFYVMPLVEGESLRDLLARQGRIPLEEALRITREVADALDYAHRHGVIHRDIKPENILLSDGHAVVADFGLGRAMGEATPSAITHSGQSLGTPQYMSPEQITGEKNIDGRTDTYALGCVLFEMLAGMAPGGGTTIQSLLARRLTEPPPRVREVNPAVPESVEAALTRALATERDARFATAGDFGRALGLPTPPPGSVPTRRARVLGRVLAGAAVLALVVLTVSQILPAPSSARIASLALAPLSDETADSASYLGEGIHEAVADLLRRLPQLRVIAPSFVAQLLRQSPTMDPLELGNRLNVEALLTWRLRRSNDSIHLRAELVRLPSGQLLWGAAYQRPLQDVLALQGEIARAITDSLRLELSGAERATFAARPTTSAAAYDAYLRGRHFYTRATPAGTRGALEMVDSVLHYGRQALAMDSGFAGAWALLSNYHRVKAVRDSRAVFAAEVDSSLQLARRALSLDSTIGDAWVIEGTHSFYYVDDWDATKRVYERGIRLSPSDPALRGFYAIYLGEAEGRLDSAIAMAHQATELGGETIYLNTLGDLLMRARRYDSAIVVLRKAVETDPSVPGPQLRLITSFERTRRYAEAVAARRAWRGAIAAEPFERGFAQSGEAGYQRALQAELRARIDTVAGFIGTPRQYPRDSLPPIPETRLALLYGQLGDWAQATDWVLREYQIRPKRLRLWLTHPDMQGLRGDPRFQALVRKEGLR